MHALFSHDTTLTLSDCKAGIIAGDVYVAYFPQPARDATLLGARQRLLICCFAGQGTGVRQKLEAFADMLRAKVFGKEQVNKLLAQSQGETMC